MLHTHTHARTRPDFRSTPWSTNLEEEMTADVPGNDVNASMLEQVKRPNPWRKMIMMMMTHTNTQTRARAHTHTHTQTHTHTHTQNRHSTPTCKTQLFTNSVPIFSNKFAVTSVWYSQTQQHCTQFFASRGHVTHITSLFQRIWRKPRRIDSCIWRDLFSQSKFLFL